MNTIPFGLWPSPVTPAACAAVTTILEMHFDGSTLFWVETRPNEKGRRTILRLEGTHRREVLPNGFSAMNEVHTYGGGAMTIGRRNEVFFTNASDGRIYRLDGVRPPQAVTPEGPFRYADLTYDPFRMAVICVREDHSDATREAVNQIVRVDVASENVRVLATGADFYAAPRLSPGGEWLAWIEWDHPNMPWDVTRLCRAAVCSDGALDVATTILDGAVGQEAVMQPAWSPQSVLHFLTDRSGYWNIYRYEANSQTIMPLMNVEGDVGTPSWKFGQSAYAFDRSGRIHLAVRMDGAWKLALLDATNPSAPPTLTMRPSGNMSEIVEVRHSGKKLAVLGGSSNQPLGVDIEEDKGVVMHIGEYSQIDRDDTSVPAHFRFATSDNDQAFAFYYPPRNADAQAPANTLPPVIVIAHGGPTSQTSVVYRMDVQYWTTRGFGVIDVDYRGSSGYGRTYRRRLANKWGVYDVDDCVAAAQALINLGQIDPNRIVIRGRSAGGYTTLAALAFRTFFKAGASHFGISDLTTLNADTHKFESRYLDQLVPATELAARSPFYAADRFNCPMIIFQGGKDESVPPSQAQKIVDALAARGIDHEYVFFPNEGHGFKDAANITHAFDRELAFLRRVLNLG